MKNKIHPELENKSENNSNVNSQNSETKKKKKENIPRALREQVWLKYCGNEFEIKCPVRWCKNKITAFDFHVGHNVPEKYGGTLDINNLRPICSKCNLSMGSKYTIDQWDIIAINNPKCCVIC